jgi:LuxR family transcriptional regulator, quorum-sensing system regulator SdiA
MQISVQHLLCRFSKAAPSGFVLGFNVDFVAPGYVFSTYPPAWLEIYDAEGLIVKDPTVGWAFRNEGCVRWSNLRDQDPDGVLERAATHEIRFGATVSLRRDGARVMGGFSRPDREMSDLEIDACKVDLATLHDIGLREGLGYLRREMTAAKASLPQP